MPKGVRKKKDIDVNIDTKNVDVHITRKDGKTAIELDTPLVDVTYTKDGEHKDIDVKIHPLEAVAQIVTRIIKRERG